MNEFRAYVALVREVFGSSTHILGAETGGGESLAEFIVQGSCAPRTNVTDVLDLQSDLRSTASAVHLLFPCAQARLDVLPNRLSREPSSFPSRSHLHTLVFTCRHSFRRDRCLRNRSFRHARSRTARVPHQSRRKSSSLPQISSERKDLASRRVGFLQSEWLRQRA